MLTQHWNEFRKLLIGNISGMAFSDKAIWAGMERSDHPFNFLSALQGANPMYSHKMFPNRVPRT